MIVPLAASAARRRAAMAAQQQQRRAMGGGHAPAPEWEGIDKVVRGYFPQDHQRTLPLVVSIGSWRFRIPLIFVSRL